jgi:hypothetical protein
MANADKQRILGLKEDLERAREKQQRELTARRDLDSRREWLNSELMSTLEKTRSIIFMEPSEVASLIARRDALSAMLDCMPLERQMIQYRITAAEGDVRNAEKRLREEETPPETWRQDQFLRA